MSHKSQFFSLTKAMGLLVLPVLVLASVTFFVRLKTTQGLLPAASRSSAQTEPTKNHASSTQDLPLNCALQQQLNMDDTLHPLKIQIWDETSDHQHGGYRTLADEQNLQLGQAFGRWLESESCSDSS